MRKVECPACKGEVPRWEIGCGTFPCPLCQEPLRMPRPSRLWAVPLFVFGLPLGYFLSHLLGLQDDNHVLLGTIFLGIPAGFVVGSLIGFVRGILFLRLERNPNWDDGDILHITPQRGPPKKPPRAGADPGR
jgi:hypothetical protein